MKICVLVKEVPDAAVEKRINPSTGRLDRSGEKNLNPFDTHAIEAAMQLKEGGQVEVDEVVAADDDRVALAAQLAGEARSFGYGAQRVLVEGAVLVQDVGQDVAHDRSFLSSSQATIFSTVSFVSSSSMIWPAAFSGGAAKSLQCARAWS